MTEPLRGNKLEYKNMTKFTLKLIAPDGVKYESEADEAILPTEQGQITILPNHMPLIALLCPGEIILKNNNKEHFLVTEGGVVEITNNTVKILADTAEDADSLNQIAIEEAKKKALEALSRSTTDQEFASAYSVLEKQLARINFMKRRKKYK